MWYRNWILMEYKSHGTSEVNWTHQVFYRPAGGSSEQLLIFKIRRLNISVPENSCLSWDWCKTAQLSVNNPSANGRTLSSRDTPIMPFIVFHVLISMLEVCDVMTGSWSPGTGSQIGRGAGSQLGAGTGSQFGTGTGSQLGRGHQQFKSPQILHLSCSSEIQLWWQRRKK